MGYLGIEFLRKEQQRRNDLIRLDMNGNDNSQPHSTAPTKSTFEGGKAKTRNKDMEKSRRFQRGAVPFILLTAAPYMLQIIALGNINFFAYTCFEHDIHRAVRLNKLFSHDSYLVAMANDSATPPQGMTITFLFLQKYIRNTNITHGETCSFWPVYGYCCIYQLRDFQ